MYYFSLQLSEKTEFQRACRVPHSASVIASLFAGEIIFFLSAAGSKFMCFYRDVCSQLLLSIK